MGAVRWATVADATAAYRVWETSGVRGRRLVVLTGRWSRPRSLAVPGEAGGAGVRASDPAGHPLLDADGALFLAAQVGIARRLDVVMPPEAYLRRRSEVAGQKDVRLLDGALELPFQGLERRFSKPGALAVPEEPVILLLEPSWFQDGAPEGVGEWLSAAGVRFDLALIALSDPAATGAQRDRARRLGESLGAPFLETSE